VVWVKEKEGGKSSRIQRQQRRKTDGDERDIDKDERERERGNIEMGERRGETDKREKRN
jgi:hypothetical protein